MNRKRFGAEVGADLRGGAEVPEIGEQAIGDVDRGRGPRRGVKTELDLGVGSLLSGNECGGAQRQTGWLSDFLRGVL